MPNEQKPFPELEQVSARRDLIRTAALLGGALLTGQKPAAAASGDWKSGRITAKAVDTLVRLHLHHLPAVQYRL